MQKRHALTLAVGIASAASLTCLGAIGVAQATPASKTGTPSTAALAHSYLGKPAGATALGIHQVSKMSTLVQLAPRDAAGLSAELAGLYTKGSPTYHHWLGKGQFTARYAPTAATRAAVAQYLRGKGLTVRSTSSPFRLQATGSSAQQATAFSTTLTNYTAKNGTHFFANSSAIRVPTSLASSIVGVVGLDNTGKQHAAAVAVPNVREHPGYGAGPGKQGLTPSQTTHLYNLAPDQKTAVGKGSRSVLAVYELSGYLRSDIYTWAKQFYGASYHPKLADITVDGGPLNPQCASSDMCNKGPDYSGDIEVDADIEMELALAPDATILVYNAPNSDSGAPGLAEYQQIATDDIADTVSSSWGECEPDAGIGYAQAENQVFEQLAAQGQSVFSAAGDTGAFDCLRDTGSPNLTNVAVDDPASQPYVTGVGGTSFGTYDPESNETPSYPKGDETVWNPLNLCGPGTQGQTNCGNFGASGGGVSQFWAAKSTQSGPGVISSQSKYGSYCGQSTSTKTLCREVPDVSANADEYTPYAEYCTGSTSTNSVCAQFSGAQTPPGWFGIGGTSLSTPLWASMIGDADSILNGRVGDINPLVYKILRNSKSYAADFHDITGKNQVENWNGVYYTTPNYDMTTGIGTPNATALIKSIT